MKSARHWGSRVLAFRLGVLFIMTLIAHVAHGQTMPAPVEIGANWKLVDVANESARGEAIAGVDFASKADAQWHKAVVPGTVLTSLVADGTYPEPLYGENNRPDKIPDSLCRTS